MMAEKKNKATHWLLWWRLDPEEVANSVATYQTKNPLKSARGIAALCFLFSVAISTALVLTGSTQAGGLTDVVVFLVLALFTYLGHRWAMLAGMAWWTLEKVYAVYTGMQAPNPSGSLLITSVIWWCIYMHAFWFAFKVEQERRNPTATVVASEFD